jgi:hypothetical protein
MTDVTIAQVKKSDHPAPEGMHLYVVSVNFSPHSAIAIHVTAPNSAQAVEEAKQLAEQVAHIPPSQFTSD